MATHAAEAPDQGSQAGKAAPTGTSQAAASQRPVLSPAVLLRLLEKSDMPGVVRLVQLGADANLWSEQACCNPLMLAAWFGDVPAIKALLEKGADVNAPDTGHLFSRHEILGYMADERCSWDEAELRARGTPLMRAAYGKHPHAMYALIAAGARVDDEDAAGRTALTYAIKGGAVQAINALLDGGADPNRRCLDGTTPLHQAAETGDLRALQRLIAKGGDPRVATANSGYTVLMAAVAHPGIVSVLLKHKCDPNARDADGRTALMGAAAIGAASSVAALLKAGADPNAVDDWRCSALHHVATAAMNGSSDCVATVEALLRAGADPQLRNINGFTAQHEAGGSPEVAQVLKRAAVLQRQQQQQQQQRGTGDSSERSTGAAAPATGGQAGEQTEAVGGDDAPAGACVVDGSPPVCEKQQAGAAGAAALDKDLEAVVALMGQEWAATKLMAAQLQAERTMLEQRDAALKQQGDKLNRRAKLRFAASKAGFERFRQSGGGHLQFEALEAEHEKVVKWFERAGEALSLKLTQVQEDRAQFGQRVEVLTQKMVALQAMVDSVGGQVRSEEVQARISGGDSEARGHSAEAAPARSQEGEQRAEDGQGMGGGQGQEVEGAQRDAAAGGRGNECNTGEAVDAGQESGLSGAEGGCGEEQGGGGQEGVSREEAASVVQEGGSGEEGAGGMQEAGLSGQMGVGLEESDVEQEDRRSCESEGGQNVGSSAAEVAGSVQQGVRWVMAVRRPAQEGGGYVLEAYRHAAQAGGSGQEGGGRVKAMHTTADHDSRGLTGGEECGPSGQAASRLEESDDGQEDSGSCGGGSGQNVENSAAEVAGSAHESVPFRSIVMAIRRPALEGGGYVLERYSHAAQAGGSIQESGGEQGAGLDAAEAGDNTRSSAADDDGCELRDGLNTAEAASNGQEAKGWWLMARGETTQDQGSEQATRDCLEVERHETPERVRYKVVDRSGLQAGHGGQRSHGYIMARRIASQDGVGYLVLERSAAQADSGGQEGVGGLHDAAQDVGSEQEGGSCQMPACGAAEADESVPEGEQQTLPGDVADTAAHATEAAAEVMEQPTRLSGTPSEYVRAVMSRRQTDAELVPQQGVAAVSPTSPQQQPGQQLQQPPQQAGAGMQSLVLQAAQEAMARRAAAAAATEAGQVAAASTSALQAPIMPAVLMPPILRPAIISPIIGSLPIPQLPGFAPMPPASTTDHMAPVAVPAPFLPNAAPVPAPGLVPHAVATLPATLSQLTRALPVPSAVLAAPMLPINAALSVSANTASFMPGHAPAAAHWAASSGQPPASSAHAADMLPSQGVSPLPASSAQVPDTPAAQGVSAFPASSAQAVGTPDSHGRPVQPVKPKRRKGLRWEEEHACVCCLERERCMELVPCGHAVLCTQCCASIQTAKNECPMCRQPITAVLAYTTSSQL